MSASTATEHKKTDAPMDGEGAGTGEQTASGAAMALAAKAFKLGLPDDVVPDKASIKSELLAEIESKKMAPFYERLVNQYNWQLDASLLERLKKANVEDIAKIDASIANARENFGDVEVFDFQRDKAEYYARIGDKDAALKAYADINEKKLSTGQKIDIAMAKVRIGFTHGDFGLVKEQLEIAKTLNEKGGDWDRRNRLKVYEATQAMAARDFPRAARLLLDSIATFTATEMYDYKTFVFYAVLMALKSLDRVTLKKSVVDSPDVLSVLPDVPHLAQLLNAFYEGRYKDFLQALADIFPAIAADRFLGPHATFYLREMRVAAYTQFLESYKSVTLDGMAHVFGVSAPFLDRELSRFIASGRINAKIDAVAGVIETTRPDTKNAQYHAVIKQGDALLTRIQKLSRVVSV